MGAAISMLQMSLQPGCNDKYMQFSSVRKFRSTFSYAYLASAEGQQATVLARDNRKMIVTKCPTNGDFFERFVRGLHKQMGDVVKQDKAISQPIMVESSSLLEEEWANMNSDKYTVAREGAFYLIAYCCALHGEETVTTDLYGIRKHWIAGHKATDKHVVVALLGRFKGKTGENYHLMPIVAVTYRGLEPRKWI